MLRAAVYVRISDDRMGGGLGVERQEKDCRVLAERLGWEVTEVYADNDLSAYSKNRKAKDRPAYERLKADLAAGHVRAVIAWHTDRLHRTPRQLEDFIDICEKADVSVETVQAGIIDLRTPAGRAMARTLCAWAFYESEHKGERIRAKNVQLAEAGAVGNGGFRPFGYTKDRMSLIPEEAEALRDAYAQILAGRSLRSVALSLTTAGHLTTQGAPWSTPALRYNLLSGRNAGLREHRKVIVGPALWPPIIDRATWEQATAILTAPHRFSDPQRAHHSRGARTHLLTGLIWCGRCGGKLLPRSLKGRGQRYGCLPTQEGGCGGSTTNIARTDETILEAVFARLERSVDLTPDPPLDRTGELLARIAADEQRLEALGAAFADDHDSNPLEMRAAGAKIRARIEAARREIGQAVTQRSIAEPLAVRAAWSTYDLQQRRAVVEALIDRIDVGPGVPGRFTPERLTIRWR